jgi:hypothetical protein
MNAAMSRLDALRQRHVEEERQLRAEIVREILDEYRQASCERDFIMVSVPRLTRVQIEFLQYVATGPSSDECKARLAMTFGPPVSQMEPVNDIKEMFDLNFIEDRVYLTSLGKAVLEHYDVALVRGS